jgi:hypothetical protein
MHAYISTPEVGVEDREFKTSLCGLVRTCLKIKYKGWGCSSVVERQLSIPGPRLTPQNLKK